MLNKRSPAMIEALGLVAPGSLLREGLDRILHSRSGALIVVGDSPEVLNISTGGFYLDAEFTAPRLSELAKMDGAILLSGDTSRIVRANVHLLPDSDIATSETGTRHRTAERVGSSIDVAVIAVSEDRSTIVVYRNGESHRLESVPRLINLASQALQALDHYKSRLDAVSGALSALEVEDLVTVRDVAIVVQRAEMVQRIISEVDAYIVELGENGRLMAMQLEELTAGVAETRSMVIRDYLPDGANPELEPAYAAMSELSSEHLSNLTVVASALGLTAGQSDLETKVVPRGYRLLSNVPRLTQPLVERLVARFGNLREITQASVSDLDGVEGIGIVKAQTIKEGLTRLSEVSILDRYS